MTCNHRPQGMIWRPYLTCNCCIAATCNRQPRNHSATVHRETTQTEDVTPKRDLVHMRKTTSLPSSPSRQTHQDRTTERMTVRSTNEPVSTSTSRDTTKEKRNTPTFHHTEKPRTHRCYSDKHQTRRPLINILNHQQQIVE